MFLGTLLCGGTVSAGYLVDAWKTGSPQEVCTWAADQVGYAINRRLADVPLIFKDRDDLPFGYDINRVPRDALYITGYNTLDSEDKEFFTKFITLGYALAERKLKDNPNTRFPEDFGEDYDKFMATCVAHKNNQEEIFRQIRTGSATPLTEEQATKMILGKTFIDNEAPILEEEILSIREIIKSLPETYDEFEKQAASNQNLGKEPIGFNEALFLCNELRYDINLIARSISEGEPLENMIDLAKRSVESLREDRLARILRMLPEAYDYKGPIAEWMEKEYKECSQ